MPTILVTEKIHDDGLAILRGIAEAHVIEGWHLSETEIQATLPSINAMLVRAAWITGEMISAAPGLKVISRHGVGCDRIDLEAARCAGVTVAIAADANARSVAEHTLMFILALAKNLCAMDQIVREHYGRRTEPRIVDVSGRRILVLGYGRIGKLVAPLCAAFGMQVVLRDILLDGMSTHDGFEVAATLEEGLRGADAVTVHVPLTDETRSLLGQREMALLNPGAFVVNCARGGIVDEQALADLCASGHLGGAASDVFSQEPIRNENPILGIEGALLTPHYAASSEEGTRRMSVRSASNIRDFFAGSLPPDMIFPLG